MASTKEVLDHHLKCFAEGDLEGILFDYAPGAVLFTPDGPLKGADAIRPLFQAMVAEFGKPAATVEFGKPGATFSLEQQFIEGDYAYIMAFGTKFPLKFSYTSKVHRYKPLSMCTLQTCPSAAAPAVADVPSAIAATRLTNAHAKSK